MPGTFTTHCRKCNGPGTRQVFHSDTTGKIKIPGKKCKGVASVMLLFSTWGYRSMLQQRRDNRYY